MKPQDIIFVIVLVGLIALRKPKILVTVGLACLMFSIPLFAFWIFFTAERLVYYAAGFFLVASVLILLQKTNK